MLSVTGQYEDARARGISERYLRLKEQASQSQELGSEPPIVDSNALYYEAVGGARKRRVYGLGSTTFTFYPSSSSSTAWTPTSDNCNELVQSLQRRLDEKEQHEKEMEEEMQAMKATNEKLMTQVFKIHEFMRRMMSQQTYSSLSQFPLEFPFASTPDPRPSDPRAEENENDNGDLEAAP
ncbi:hypothetical protein P3X46_013824 [Hevea brasiliensis]|uniref:Uncharacterized protein n=1 Tax=Hevea brasiliensis TaxID=3981 RepID=A0ABQ9M4R5_HEVBR|nr:hypothetical protein P3X46_013824 [Hevea brasiliensis]